VLPALVPWAWLVLLLLGHSKWLLCPENYPRSLPGEVMLALE